MTKKYEWTVSDCAPKNFTSRIYFGSLHYGKNSGASVPDGKNIDNGWGRPGTSYGSKSLKEVPDKLEIVYMSFRENKFYGGSFKLPKEKMEELFEEGFLKHDFKTDKEVKKTYDKIVVGVGPGGLVGVWLNGYNNSVQVATFYGEETDVDFSRLIPNGITDRELYVSNRLKEISQEELEKPIPFGLWETYAKRYQWKPVIESELLTEVKLLNTTYYNGDKEALFKSDAEKLDFKFRAIPENVFVDWGRSNGAGVRSKFYFDETEMFQTFNQLLTDPETQQGELVFKFKGTQEADVFLKVGDRQKQLEKVKLETYNSSL